MVKAYSEDNSGSLQPVAPLSAADATIAFGAFRFDAANGLLYRDGQEVPLPPRALGVLSLLLRRSGQVVSKRELLDTVWKDVMVEEASLKEAISSLRQTLGDDPKQPTYIRTVHRRGYRFVARTTASVPTRATVRPRPPGALPPVRWMVAGFVAGTLLGATSVWLWASRSGEAANHAAIRFAVVPKAGDELVDSGTPSLAIAADGSEFAFVSRHGDTSHLYVETLNRSAPVEIAGSDGAAAPFFSPDGRWVGFCSGAALKIAPVGGGASARLAPIGECDGASWGADGNIVYGSADGLWRVPAKGGTPTALTRIDSAHGEVGHWWPRVLPDGTVLFTVWKTVLNDAEIALLAPGATDYRVIFEGASDPEYLPDGRLLVARQGGVMALPFDLAAGKVNGPPSAVQADVRVNTFMGFAQLAVAPGGTRIMMTGPPRTAARIVWADMSGATTPTALPVRNYRNARLSADGRRVAATINSPNGYDVWVGDLTRGSLTRLTSEARNTEPVWSPDGHRIAYASSLQGPVSVMERNANGSGSSEVLASGAEPRYPSSWSPDGTRLTFGVMAADGNEDMWVVNLDGEPHQAPYLRTPSSESGARFSPDGRWIAYVSDASGRFPGDSQVFLRAFPAENRPSVRVSTGSGTDPLWAPDGRAIYYKSGDGVMEVDVQLSDPPQIGEPRQLFEAPDAMLRGISPDGARLLLIDRERRDDSANRVVVEVH